MSANSEFDDWAKRLSTTLTDIEQKANAENTSPAELSQSIDEWFITLSALNSYIRHQALEQEEDASLLQRHNLLLAIAVLAYSLFLGAFHIWMSKRQQSQFHFEVSSLYDETRKDPLTGLLNRRGWLHFTHYTLKRIAKFGSTPVAVAILDIDYFKQYNDTYGHDAGDLRLVEFAEMIRGNFRPSDTVARVGGEEFAVLLPNCTVEDAKRIIDRIREIKQNNISFSAGVADLEECKTVEGAMAVADQALYQAKQAAETG
ncbi:MAG: GGDEF domain-containing protein [Limnobacter sp.]|nr:GGDEF domain-containing protein [Limnobacter sp.]